ncbi:hypothetical protein GGR54DRAFT_601729 [Hypoxylon sp. NC1633]|nr:hypothetical protein GGR54DRAFT_601729 [Hypoxylon sp. NC1633]
MRQGAGVALCLAFGQATLAAPILARRDTCSKLSSTTPNWKISNAESSDWPGGESGRVELFARHVPTNQLMSCNVPYRLNSTSGEIIDYDPTAIFNCINFGAKPVNTTVQLSMDTLLLNLSSSWACDEDETVYTATGSTLLQRDTSPGACLIEPTQVGEATTCPIADTEIEGKLAA